METRMAMTFYLEEHDRPSVTTHAETNRSVSLHVTPGIDKQSERGFSIQFLTCHLGVARQLVEALEAMKRLED